MKVFADDSFCIDGFVYSIMEDHRSVALASYKAQPETDYSRPLHVEASVVFEGKTYPVKKIDARAFQNVSEVREIVIDEGIEDIGNYAFYGCTNLKSIFIPSSVMGIGEGIFGSCYNLTSVEVDPDNESLDSRDGSNAIIDSDNDELLVACSSTKIPASVKSLADFSFYYCSVMEQLVIPEGVKTIGNRAFFGCSSLQSIVLPESLTEIGGEAFLGCKSLRHIKIPSSVTKIDKTAFKGCDALDCQWR